MGEEDKLSPVVSSLFVIKTAHRGGWY